MNKYEGDVYQNYKESKVGFCGANFTGYFNDLNSGRMWIDHSDCSVNAGANMLLITFVIGRVVNILYITDIISPIVDQILSVSSGSIILVIWFLSLNNKVKNLPITRNGSEDN